MKNLLPHFSGMLLVRVETEAENKFLKEKLQLLQYSSREFWYGGKREGDTWVWKGGTGEGEGTNMGISQHGHCHTHMKSAL